MRIIYSWYVDNFLVSSCHSKPDLSKSLWIVFIQIMMAINIQNDNKMFLLWVETVRKCFYLDFLCVRGSKNISCIRSHLHLVISKKLISGDECWSAVLYEWQRWRNGVMCTISRYLHGISTGYLQYTLDIYTIAQFSIQAALDVRKPLSSRSGGRVRKIYSKFFSVVSAVIIVT